MPVDVIMPALGMAQETGTVVRWLKEDGAVVVKGEPLLEVETDKVTVEIEAPADGTLAGVSAPAGTEVPVGTVIALVVAAGESPTRRLASPKARRLAAERGVDLDALAGSGPNGAIVASDIGTSEAVPAPVASVWRTMAERMERAWREVPQFVLARDVDATRLQQRPDGVSVTDLLVKHAAEALARHPRLTASWQGGALVPGDGIHVGIAVATDEALVVPVVHDADRLELTEIADRRRTLAAAARSGTLRPEDVRRGTFTISNLGMYGVDAFQAIVNPPQAAILAVGRIVDRPVVADGALTARPVLTLTVSFDHRVVDGARGAEFLDTLASLVEGAGEAEA